MIPDQISLSIAGSIAIAMITAMGFLWKRIQKLENKVDSISAGRLADEKSHSAAYVDLTKKVLESNKDLADTLKSLVVQINAQTDILRKCRFRESGHFTPPPQESLGDTTALLKKGQEHG